MMFQHTAARRRLQSVIERSERIHSVSTHSRPKAAAGAGNVGLVVNKFQHTAARRRLLAHILNSIKNEIVSTHSRPKAAANGKKVTLDQPVVSTHSRPKAAADLLICSE